MDAAVTLRHDRRRRRPRAAMIVRTMRAQPVNVSFSLVL
jgi:hypothetical protein